MFTLIIFQSAAIWHASQKKLLQNRSKTGTFTLSDAPTIYGGQSLPDLYELSQTHFLDNIVVSNCWSACNFNFSYYFFFLVTLCILNAHYALMQIFRYTELKRSLIQKLGCIWQICQMLLNQHSSSGGSTIGYFVDPIA